MMSGQYVKRRKPGLRSITRRDAAAHRTETRGQFPHRRAISTILVTI